MSTKRLIVCFAIVIFIGCLISCSGQKKSSEVILGEWEFDGIDEVATKELPEFVEKMKNNAITKDKNKMFALIVDVFTEEFGGMKWEFTKDSIVMELKGTKNSKKLIILAEDKNSVIIDLGEEEPQKLKIIDKDHIKYKVPEGPIIIFKRISQV